MPEVEDPLDDIEYKNIVGQVFNFIAPVELKEATMGGYTNYRAQAKEKTKSIG